MQLFLDQRSSIVNALDQLITHIPLIEGTQSTHTDWLRITKSLTDEKARLNSLLPSNNPQDTGNISCLGDRIGVINSHIDRMIEDLENFNAALTADSLLIISTQIGLLSFQGLEDPQAAEMERRAQELERKFNAGSCLPSGAGPRPSSLWEALTLSVSGCSCRHCKNR
ncbi:uncharacterized protein N7503_010190 [Penicillium pulvis]|uniref:uncharacterized protein n=1 Tax=Penicillium pulvis TaxID=1562058 RepID=UPI0025471BD6|nr:uncharacterized protein N7503_010190 [Penicillium pulvis]KAJ5784978.1 hypothetical protein N7503_010190 [Penicillium pulvis]